MIQHNRSVQVIPGATNPRGHKVTGPKGWTLRISLVTAILGVSGAIISQVDKVKSWVTSSNHVSTLSFSRPGAGPSLSESQTNGLSPLQLSSPIPVQQDLEDSPSRFIDPPKLMATALGDAPIAPAAVHVFFGRHAQNKEVNSIIPVDQEFMTYQPPGPSSQMTAYLDTANVILQHYPKAPYGWYRVQYEVDQPGLPASARSQYDFNYIFRAEFDDNDRKWIPKARSVFTPFDRGHGLQINHSAAGGGYSSADVLQDFRFHDGFEISAWFTATSTSSQQPISLEIAALNQRTGDSISVVLADGYPDAYTIKTHDELGERTSPMRVGGHAETALVMDGGTRNYFMIRFARDQDLASCKLWVGRTRPDGKPMPVHYAFTQPWIVDGNKIQLTLRVRRAGLIQLSDLELAEVP